MRKLILIPIVLLIIQNVNAQPEKRDNPLQNYTDEWVEDPFLKNAAISFIAYDLNGMRIIADHNSNMALVPASTMKLVTTATAFEILGSGYRFKTRIQYSGEVDSMGVLHGNIYIKGGGDPSLGSSYYKSFNADYLDKWLKAIKDAGIKEIDGHIIGDATIIGDNMTPANWSWGDLGNYYGAPPCGLTIHDNKTTLLFRSGPKAGDSTWMECMEPYVPEMFVYNKVKAATANKDNAYIYGAQYDPMRLAEGSIHLGEEAFKVKASIHDPAYLAAHELESKLAENGILCKYACSTVRRDKIIGNYVDTLERKSIHTLSGASVGNLAYWTNMVSVNLFAEHLFRGIGIRLYGNGSTYSSEKGVRSAWSKRGVNMTGFQMTDGSGLSRANAVSARHLMRILKYMNKSKYKDSFRKTLSVAGKSGTLSSIGRGTRAANNLMGKSGSMTRVRSYAGYVKTASGRQLAFAIIVNNYTCTGYQMKQRLQKLMVKMANYNQ